MAPRWRKHVFLPLYHDYSALYWDRGMTTIRKTADAEAYLLNELGKYPWKPVTSTPMFLSKIGKLDTFDATDEPDLLIDETALDFFRYMTEVNVDAAAAEAQRRQLAKDVRRLGWARKGLADDLAAVFADPSMGRCPEYIQGMDRVVNDWRGSVRGLRILLLAVERLNDALDASRFLFRVSPGENTDPRDDNHFPLFDTICESMRDRTDVTQILNLARRVVHFSRTQSESPLRAALQKRVDAFFRGEVVHEFLRSADLYTVFQGAGSSTKP